MKRWIGFLLLLLVAFMGSGCDRKQGLEALLLPAECAPPCWNLLTPGQTTRDEALLRLKQMPELIDPKSVFTSTEASHWIGWRFTNSELDGQIEIRDGKVSTIFIGERVPYRTKYGVRLDRMIELYGEPTDIFYNDTHGDVLATEMFIVNRKRGICYTSIQSIDKLIIAPDQIVKWVFFFNLANYPDALPSSFGGRNPEEVHFPWTGYTEIKLR
jgi:hypothetical protein